jgi:thioredoxin
VGSAADHGLSDWLCHFAAHGFEPAAQTKVLFAMPIEYENPGPTREEIDATQGPTLLEFGTGWCGYCQAAAPSIAEALAEFPSVQHIKVEDGPGRRLGRSFRVKLWPTAIFLKDGAETTRAVRPESANEIRLGLKQIT